MLHEEILACCSPTDALEERANRIRERHSMRFSKNGNDSQKNLSGSSCYLAEVAGRRKTGSGFLYLRMLNM